MASMLDIAFALGDNDSPMAIATPKIPRGTLKKGSDPLAGCAAVAHDLWACAETEALQSSAKEMLLNDKIK
jgi:hypothetical protein